MPNNIKIIGFGLFVIGLVLVVESLLILLLIFNMRPVLSQLTFFVGIGCAVFKMAAGFIGVAIGAKPLSSGKSSGKRKLRGRRQR